MKQEWAPDGPSASQAINLQVYEPTVMYSATPDDISSQLIAELDGSTLEGESGEAPPEHVKESDSLPPITGAGFEGVTLESYEYVAGCPTYRSRTFEQGGPATKIEHLTGETIALDFTQSHDLGKHGQPLL